MKTIYKILIPVGSLFLLILIALSVFFFGFFLPQRKEKKEWEKQVYEYTQNKLAAYEAENDLVGDYEIDVAFLGDSLTDGYDVKKYYPQYAVSNRGIGGDTTFKLEARLKTSVYDLKPKVVVMLIGANNAATMFENYESILKGFQENLPETKVVLVSLTSMGGEHWGKNNQLAAYNNVKIKKLAEKYSYTYVDMYSPLLNLETGEIYEEYTSDGGHLTEKGYEVFTATLTPVLEEILKNYQGTTN